MNNKDIDKNHNIHKNKMPNKKALVAGLLVLGATTFGGVGIASYATLNNSNGVSADESYTNDNFDNNNYDNCNNVFSQNQSFDNQESSQDSKTVFRNNTIKGNFNGSLDIETVNKKTSASGENIEKPAEIVSEESQIEPEQSEAQTEAAPESQAQTELPPESQAQTELPPESQTELPPESQTELPSESQTEEDQSEAPQLEDLGTVLEAGL